MPRTHSGRASSASLWARATVSGRRRRARVAVSGVEDDLRDAFAIAKIDEDAAAVVAPGRDPAEEHHFLAHVAGAERAAAVGPFEFVDESRQEKPPSVRA